MEIFTKPGQARQQMARYRRRRNPAPGRTANESRRIRRTLEKLRDHIDHTIELTGSRELPWLPSHYVLTDTDDESVIDWRGMVETRADYTADEDGLLVDLHDAGIKASNRIAAVTVYKAVDDEGLVSHYMIRKTLYSPLPCPEWGALPLTLPQWRIIALTLIFSRVLWQWGQAVRDYSGNDNFIYQYTVGWNLVDTRPPFNKNRKHIIYMGEKYDGEPDEWTGNIIYKQITDEFSNQTNGGVG